MLDDRVRVQRGQERSKELPAETTNQGQLTTTDATKAGDAAQSRATSASQNNEDTDIKLSIRNGLDHKAPESTRETAAHLHRPFKHVRCAAEPETTAKSQTPAPVMRVVEESTAAALRQLFDQQILLVLVYLNVRAPCARESLFCHRRHGQGCGLWRLTKDVSVLARRHASSVADLQEHFGRDIREPHLNIPDVAVDVVHLHSDLRSAVLSTKIHERHPGLVEVISVDGNSRVVVLAARPVVPVFGVVAQRVVRRALDTRL